MNEFVWRRVKVLWMKLRIEFADFVEHENQLLELRIFKFNQSANNTTQYIFLGTLLSIFVIGFVAFIVTRSLVVSNATLKAYSLRLQQESKKSGAANVAKSQFLSTMSNEFRTPMNGVIGMTQLLEDTRLTESQKVYVRIISSYENSLLCIVNDVLDFSKLDSEMLVMDSVTFDFERVCQESIELVSSNTSGKELELIFDSSSGFPLHFMGDPTRLRQVLINLLGNAIVFTSEVFIRLGVLHETEGRVDGLLRLEVQGTGIGIKPEDREHLFDEFTQADTTTNRQYGGTGLGFAITKKLITLMGGETGFDSDYGKGTTFWDSVYLPTAESPTALRVSSLEGVRILFVDDNNENRCIFKLMLGHMGANITIVADPAEVADMLCDANQSNIPFQIAILGHNIPAISGMELGIKIPGDVQFNGLKLLIYSSVGQKGGVSLFSNAGFNRCLNKLSRYETKHAMLSALLSTDLANA